MASAGPAPSGKRSFDTEFNLVPFIDLLSCLICFLLISAVWTQVAVIDVKPTPTVPSGQPPKEPQVTLSIQIRTGGYYLSDGSSGVEMLKTGEGYPAKELTEKLVQLRSSYPDVANVTVMADGVIPYHELVAVMDLCLKYKFVDITVAGTD